jgi:hypothetical protein
MTTKPQEKPSALKREHLALQKIKFIICFQFFWPIFALLDPDTDTDLRNAQNPDTQQCNTVVIRALPAAQ